MRPNQTLEPDRKINFLRRDLEAFSPFGYSEEKIAELENKVNVFENVSTDDELKGDQMIATEKKNDAQFNDYVIYDTFSGKPEKGDILKEIG
jgi:hypothetical protein